MKWTNDKPSSEGFYWVRDHIHIGGLYIVLFMRGEGGLWGYFAGTDKATHIDDFEEGIWWQGPIWPEEEEDGD